MQETAAGMVDTFENCCTEIVDETDFYVSDGMCRAVIGETCILEGSDSLRRDLDDIAQPDNEN
jgi:hypothetical protein